jgi:phosphoglucomutase
MNAGTAGSGATVRLYLEKYEGNPDKVMMVTSAALEELVAIALSVSRMKELTGFASPTVIT